MRRTSIAIVCVGFGTLVLTSVATAQDNCASPFVMAGNSAAFDTSSATNDGPAQGNCGSSLLITKDVWYRWTAPCSGNVSASVCDATFDTKLAVYSACPSGDNTAIACNDDSNLCGTGSLRSAISFSAVAGMNYLFRIGGFNGASGTGTLNITPPVCGPVNDVCETATMLSAYGATAFTNVGATVSGPVPTTCGTGNQIAADVWFRYTACTAGSHTVHTCIVSSFDSVILVYTGTCNALTQVACNDDSCGTGGLASSATWTAAANVTYLIRVGGYQGATGSGTLTLSGPPCPPPPSANDNCGAIIPIGLGATQYSTIGTTTDGPVHALCLNAGNNQITNDLWFSYASQCTGNLTVDTCTTTSYDSRLAVYSFDGGCAGIGDATILGCNDDACGTNGIASRLTVPVVAGHIYAIRVGGFNGATGTGTLTLACTPTGLGDMNCDNAVNSLDVPLFVAALIDPGSFAGCDINRADVNQDGAINGRDIQPFVRAMP